jgi:hypothetical protein
MYIICLDVYYKFGRVTTFSIRIYKGVVIVVHSYGKLR